MSKYIHKTYPTAYAIVMRNGVPTEITYGDPEFDALNAQMNRHLEQTLTEEGEPMKDFQQRVVDEKAQLDERLAKLGHFLGSPTFKTLESEDQYLLERQRELMGELSITLGRRIARFK